MNVSVCLLARIHTTIKLSIYGKLIFSQDIIKHCYKVSEFLTNSNYCLKDSSTHSTKTAGLFSVGLSETTTSYVTL